MPRVTGAASSRARLGLYRPGAGREERLERTRRRAGREPEIASPEFDQEQSGFYPTWTMDPTSRRLAAPNTILTMPGLGPDVRANDRNPVTCSACPGVGIMQVEAAVAVLGQNIVASWNEGESSCGTGMTRQNYGWSTDGGLTFTDGGGFPPAFPQGPSLFGDAVVSVNQKTGKFYIAGLMGGGGLRGIGVVRGSFGPGGFQIELNKLVAQYTSLLDKDWVAVDSLTGNVYVMWSRPSTGFTIILQALDADLNALGPQVELSPPADPCGGQWSQVAVGPDGEVNVAWLTNHCMTDLKDVIMFRRSTDFGASFGPIVESAVYKANRFIGAPGFGRSFSSPQPILAVDRSSGPHRGRTYLAFDAALDYSNAAEQVNTTRFEQEPNDTPTQANDLLPGGKLRGDKNALESDWFRLNIPPGQMFYIETTYSADFAADSSIDGMAGRLWCDTGSGLVLAVQSFLTSNGLLYTSQTGATYYLEVYGTFSSIGPYILRTALITPGPGDVALDHRDQLLVRSDDGVNWSTPIRISDTPPGIEGQYPTAAVDARGRLFVNWMDYRDGPVCGGVTSAQYMRASGDGGVTWGLGRRISDTGSSWAGPFCNQLNNNTQGDYQQSATDGDIVVAAFTDAREGDPDIWLDVSIHHALASCSATGTVIAGVDTVVDFHLANAGNFERTMAWQVEDTRGWLAGAVPALSGSQDIAPGAPLDVHVSVRPTSCAGESTLVRFITSDPAIPGFEDTCTTAVRCRDVPTGIAVSVASIERAPDRVRLTWDVGDPALTAWIAWRRDGASAWAELGPVARTPSGAVYEDVAVRAGARYEYRLELRGPQGTVFAGEAWVDVPAAARFALTGVMPNPSARGLDIMFSLGEEKGARLELYDVAGRRLLAREVGDLGPGEHRVRIADQGQLAAGVYTVRLVQGGRHASVRAVVVQ